MSLPNNHPMSLPEGTQDESMAQTYAARHGVAGTQPTGFSTSNQPTALSEDKQDASIAGTYATRPGVGSVEQAGYSIAQDSKQYASNSQSLSDSVKGSLDKISSDSTASQSVSSTLPSAQGTRETLSSTAQSVSSQLPSAQSAADTLRQGASSLLAGISGLAIGATNTTAANANATHPESADARSVDDLHVPGAFEDETSDHEDKQAIKEGLQSAYNTLPSTGAVKQSIPESARSGAQSAYDSIPSTQDIKRHLPGAQSSNNSSQNTRVHQDGTNYIKDQLYGQGNKSGGPSHDQSALQTPSDLRPIPQVVTDSHKKAGGAAPLDRSVSSIDFVGANSTTSQLAGQVPLEPRGVPQVVVDSQKKADIGPEASANREAIQEKRLMEQELQKLVPEEPAASSTATGTTSTTDSTSNTASTSSTGIYGAIVGGLATAGTAAAGAATYARQKTHEATGTDPVSVLPESAQRSIDGTTSSTTNQTGHLPSGAVPQIVTDSQHRAGIAPEAASNPEAVQEKKQVEQELRREVAPEQAGSSNQGVTGRIAPALSGMGTTASNAATGAATSVGNAAAGAATYARQTTHQATGVDPVSVLPETAQRSIDGDTSSSRAGTYSTKYDAPSSETSRNTTSSHAQQDLGSTQQPVSTTHPLEGDGTGQGLGQKHITVPQGGLQFPSPAVNAGNPAPNATARHDTSDTMSNTGTFLNYDSSHGSTAPKVGETQQQQNPQHTHNHGVDLHSGVKNGITGLNADQGLGVPQGGLQFPHTARGNDVEEGGVAGSGRRETTRVVDGPPVHLSSVSHPDSSAGVRNGVVGAGAKREEGGS